MNRFRISLKCPFVYFAINKSQICDIVIIVVSMHVRDTLRQEFMVLGIYALIVQKPSKKAIMALAIYGLKRKKGLLRLI